MQFPGLKHVHNIHTGRPIAKTLMLTGHVMANIVCMRTGFRPGGLESYLHHVDKVEARMLRWAGQIKAATQKARDAETWIRRF